MWEYVYPRIGPGTRLVDFVGRHAFMFMLVLLVVCRLWGTERERLQGGCFICFSGPSESSQRDMKMNGQHCLCGCQCGLWPLCLCERWLLRPA